MSRRRAPVEAPEVSLAEWHAALGVGDAGWRRAAGWGAGIGLAANLPLAVTEQLSSGSFGVASLIMLAVDGAALALLLVAALAPASRPFALRAMVAPLAFALVTAATAGLGMLVERSALTSLMKRAAPVISALEKYEAHHGRPPERLDQLVPDFLPVLPDTGVPKHPDYDYRQPPGMAWELRIPHARGPFAADAMLVYRAGREGQPAVEGSARRPLNEWSYVIDG